MQIDLMVELNPSPDSNVEVQDVIGAECSIDSIRALRSERVKALREVLKGDAKDSICLTSARNRFCVIDFKVQGVPLKTGTILF